MLITFSGIDNSGKSTQIKKLLEDLRERNITCVCKWSRGGYTPLFHYAKVFLRVLTLRGNRKTVERKEARERTFANIRVQKIWLFIAIADLILYYAIYFRILNLVGKTIIADRYLYDTQIDFKLNFPAVECSEWLIWKILQMVVPHPDVSFMLVIPFDESKRRSILKNEPFPDTDPIREKRYTLYTTMSSTGKFTVVDAMQPVEMVFEKIQKTIERKK